MANDRDFKIHQRGKLGEGYVCEYLKARGCTIIATNYRCRYGEIDVIAENEVRIIFVEVKTRTDYSLAGGFESITPTKVRRLTKTAAHYLTTHSVTKEVRIDCAQVIVKPSTNALVRIDYIKNAIEQMSGYSPY